MLFRSTLRTAFADGVETSISLSADIVLSDCGTGALVRNGATPVVLDGGGHTLTQSCDTPLVSGTGVDVRFDDIVLVQQGSETAIDVTGSVALTGSSLTGAGAGSGIVATDTVSLQDSQLANFALDGVTTAGAVTLRS